MGSHRYLSMKTIHLFSPLSILSSYILSSLPSEKMVFTAAVRSAALPARRNASRFLSNSAASSSSKVLLPASAVANSSSKRSQAAPTPFVASSSSNQFKLPASYRNQARFASSSSGTKEMTVRDALNSAMEEEMLRDDSVFVLGEEVARCAFLT